MATEAVVSFVVERLGDLLIKEAQLLHGVRGQVESIKTELKRMQCLLKDADARQMKGDERVRNWVAEIRELSYDADDIIDTFTLSQAALSQAAEIARWRRIVQQISELITRYKVGKKIHQIKLKIAEISKSLVSYGIKDINDQAGGQDARLGERRRLNAMFEEQDVVGFQEEMRILKERLINGESRRCVISLVGMGGAGKTTLAKKVFRDIKNDFDCHAFIYLSQQYAIKDVLIRIIECTMSLPPGEIHNLNEEDLGKKLSDYLSGKRYLVVIDDIWTTEPWEILKCILPDNSNKSRVMLTTRNKNVALRADQLSAPHEMRLLNDREGWELFMKKIFPKGSSCPSDVEETGRQILAKCHGLPLAIAVLGGLLSARVVTLNEWSKVLESVAWHLSESPEDPCGKILALSYYDLPHYLKPCFLYFGLFPEDSEIRSKKLVRLWIAEGFIQQRGDEVLEDVAEDYLNELISRSMIQVASRRFNGSAGTCRIHDLLRDLSISEAVQNNFLTIGSDIETNSPSTRVRRLALYTDTEMHKTINCSTATLRSILNFSNEEINLGKLLKIGGKLTRVLDSRSGFIEMELPKKLGEFIHLRYLSFGDFNIKSSSMPISHFFYLQTLEFGGNGTLPNAIWNLERLRHLRAYGFYIDGHPCLNNLRNIQTLCLMAGSWIKDGLHKMTNLRKLGISKSHKALFDSIEKLCSLRSLTIMSSYSISSLKSFAHQSHLYKMYLSGQLEKLPDFPPYLAKLTLRHSQLQQDAIDILEKLPHLRILRLWEESYCSMQMICSSEGFPQLEFLILSHLDLEEWIVEEGAMPSLKNVEINGCVGLKTVSKRIRHLLQFV